MNIKVAVDSADELGEGPVWSVDEQVLYWVDIEKKFLKRWDPQTNERHVWELPSQIGSFALTKKSKCIVALRTGFAFLDLETGAVDPICDPETGVVSNRFNDGKCDRQGRFWAGTMDESAKGYGGSLYCLDTSFNCHQMKQLVGISNGLGWSPDNKTFYYTDSASRTIWSYDFDQLTGEISNEKIFAQTPENYVPDGLTVDAEGYIWSAKWDGWKIVRYSPDGKIDLELKIPVQRPTSCTFGGEDLSLLFITSARIGLDESSLSQQPLAGSLFVVETNVHGIPEPKFGF